MKISTFASVSRWSCALVGSFSPFEYLLKKHDFYGKRVIVTYEIVDDESADYLLEHNGEAWLIKEEE